MIAKTTMWQKLLIILITLVAAFSLITGLQTLTISYTNTRIIYWQHVLYYTIQPLGYILLCVVPIAFIVALLILRNSRRQVILFTLPLLVITGILVFSSDAPVSTISTVQSASMGAHVYYLARLIYEGDDNFVLYECDSIGLLCHAVYPTRLTSSYKGLRGKPAALLIDSQSRTILVEVDGEIVYTHQLS